MKASKKALAKLPSIRDLIRIRAVAKCEMSSSFISIHNLDLFCNGSLGNAVGESRSNI